MSRRGRGVATVVVAVWAFAEATVFFVIPDVALTWLASRNESCVRDVVNWVAVATLAALLGGMTVLAAGRFVPSAIEEALSAVPAISSEMVVSVYERVQADGISSLGSASSRGEPYKVYAAAAGEHGIGVIPFLLWSIVGRMPRFLVTSIVAFGIGRVVNHQRRTNVIYGVIWAAVYIAYWTKFPLFS